VSGLTYDLKMTDLDKKNILLNNAMPTPIACTWTGTRELFAGVWFRSASRVLLMSAIALFVRTIRSWKLFVSCWEFSRL
jgi:hypothetical protein